MKRAASTQKSIDNRAEKKFKTANVNDAVQALCDAIIRDDELEIKLLLQGITFTTINNKRLNALFLVGTQLNMNGCEKVINKYIQNHSYIGFIAAGIAANGGDIELLKHVLSLMQKQNIAPEYNRIAAIAAHSSEREPVEYILKVMQTENINTCYALLKEIIRNHHNLNLNQNSFVTAINLLNDINDHLANKATLFFLAVTHKCTAAVEILLEKNVNPDDSFNNENVMEVAVKNMHLPIVSLLFNDENYSIACKAAITKEQKEVIRGLMGRKIINLSSMKKIKSKLKFHYLFL